MSATNDTGGSEPRTKLTLYVTEAFIARAKHAAVDRKTSVSRIVEEAVTQALDGRCCYSSPAGGASALRDRK